MKKYCHQLIIGIDVSKDWLDVAMGSKCLRIRQTGAAIDALIAKEITAFNPRLCVLESTGGYERLIVDSLQKAGFKVHIAHPSRVRAFAKAKGWVAKTDRLDAFMLAWYGDFMGEEATISQRTSDQDHRQDLQARVGQLKQMLHGERCRFKNCIHPQVKRDI
jgi:transposase